MVGCNDAALNSRTGPVTFSFSATIWTDDMLGRISSHVDPNMCR